MNSPLVEMVFVALCGAICDCNSSIDIASFGRAKLAWLRKFLPFEQGIPSHDTFTEVFARLDTKRDGTVVVERADQSTSAESVGPNSSSR